MVNVHDYFSSNCSLTLFAYTSTNKQEEAADAGPGLGGLWTTHYFSKGKELRSYLEPGKVLYGRGKNLEPKPQTTCCLNLYVNRKDDEFYYDEYDEEIEDE